MGNKIQRIGEKFDTEIKGIIMARLKNGIDKKKTSTRKLTDLIPKHTAWEEIREDLKTFVFNNKKGFSALNTIMIMFFLFVIILFLGIYGLIFYYMNFYLTSADVTIGSANLTEATELTLGKISNAYLDKIDYIGYIIIFALILGMGINAYYTRGKYPLLMILIDVMLLVFAYIIAVYLSNAYYTFITSSDFLDIYINELSKSSKFILNLPIYCATIGVIMMVLSYIPFSRSGNELIQNEEMEGIA